MKLDDIKLGMKVLVIKDRTEEGWIPINPFIIRTWRHCDV